MKDVKAKRQFPKILRFLIRLFQIVLYVPIQIIFIPFAIVGVIIGVYKGLGNSKKLGVSYSAVKALQYRSFMHFFNVRRDTYTVEFTKKFPCESYFGLWSVMGALIISQRLFGFTTKIGKLPEAGKEEIVTFAGMRVILFDRIMGKYVEEVEQIVLPGVGFDMIALHFTEGKKVKVFELDQANTLNIKIDTMKKAGIEHDWITYIPVDYSRESWVDKLLEAGFDKTKKTLFLWQSVSLFLEPDVVKKALSEMTDLCVEGSVIAQDLYSKSFILGEYSKVVKRQMSMIEKRGEPAKFGIDMSNNPEVAVKSFLEECGLKMTEYIQMGEKLDIKPFYVIVEAEKL